MLETCVTLKATVDWHLLENAFRPRCRSSSIQLHILCLGLLQDCDVRSASFQTSLSLADFSAVGLSTQLPKQPVDGRPVLACGSG
jgi:hypothetical protein